MPSNAFLNDRKRVTGTAIVLFVVIFALRMAFSDPEDGLLFLAIVPIALLATEYRVAGGLIGAGIGSVLIVAWLVTMDQDLSPAGFLTRLLTFLVVGVGVGLATASREERESRLRDLREAEERHASAMTIHDEVVQGLTVAKMALEMDETDRAVGALDAALESARAAVTRGVVPGDRPLRSSTDA